MSATHAAHASGVNRPSAMSAPAPSSVHEARIAWALPGRMPMLSNHRAVPAILPPPKKWYHPWAARVTPEPTRRIAMPRLTAAKSSVLRCEGATARR